MIKYLDIINKIKDIRIDAIEYFNNKVSIPLILSNLDSVINYNEKSIFIERNNKKIELDQVDRRAFSEIIYILKNIDKDLYNKIDFKYVDFFEKFKLNNIELSEEIMLEDIKIETLKIIAVLNIKFWCETDEIRKEFLENMNPKEIFSKVIKKEENKTVIIEKKLDENRELTKTNWWTRFLNKIRRNK